MRIKHAPTRSSQNAELHYAAVTRVYPTLHLGRVPERDHFIRVVHRVAELMCHFEREIPRALYNLSLRYEKCVKNSPNVGTIMYSGSRAKRTLI